MHRNYFKSPFGLTCVILQFRPIDYAFRLALGDEDIPMINLCISSLVVQAKPALMDRVRNDLESIPEAEVSQ